jgi:hypothetical protein
MTSEDHMKLLNWLATGDTGMSSEYVAYTLAGVSPEQLSHAFPHDSSDLGRIVELLDLMGWHDRFKAEFGHERHGKYWQALFGVWDQLVELYRTFDRRAVSQSIRLAVDDVTW